MRPVILVLIAFIAAASCISDRSSVTGPPAGAECAIPGSAIGPNNAVVLIRGFRFLQDTVRIRQGMTVTWVNCEAANIEAHTTTSDDDIWDSGLIGPGESWARTFDAPGTFSYFCRPHPTMRGVVIVN